MIEVINAIYHDGTFVLVQKTNLLEGQRVCLQIVPPMVQVTARTAKRKVTRFLLDEVSYLMGAEQPKLTQAERLVWRVPIVLTYPTHGTVGQVGFIDVNAENGDLLLTLKMIEDIKHHAQALAETCTPTPTLRS